MSLTFLDEYRNVAHHISDRSPAAPFERAQSERVADAVRAQLRDEGITGSFIVSRAIQTAQQKLAANYEFNDAVQAALRYARNQHNNPPPDAA